jgi:hypothetical protein
MYPHSPWAVWISSQVYAFMLSVDVILLKAPRCRDLQGPWPEWTWGRTEDTRHTKGLTHSGREWRDTWPEGWWPNWPIFIFASGFLSSTKQEVIQCKKNSIPGKQCPLPEKQGSCSNLLGHTSEARTFLLSMRTPKPPCFHLASLGVTYIKLGPGCEGLVPCFWSFINKYLQVNISFFQTKEPLHVSSKPQWETWSHLQSLILSGPC